ncbi:hypothetical protein Aperf_G00000083872 [Anoplocephala perfoliata]
MVVLPDMDIYQQGIAYFDYVAIALLCFFLADVCHMEVGYLRKENYLFYSRLKIAIAVHLAFEANSDFVAVSFHRIPVVADYNRSIDSLRKAIDFEIAGSQFVNKVHYAIEVHLDIVAVSFHCIPVVADCHMVLDDLHKDLETSRLDLVSMVDRAIEAHFDIAVVSFLWVPVVGDRNMGIDNPRKDIDMEAVR